MAPQMALIRTRPCRRGYVALSVLTAGLATLTLPRLASSGPIQGLDLVKDFTQETIESMRTDMSVDFLEAALLEATVSMKKGDVWDQVLQRGECTSPGEDGCSWPTYSMTDMYGVLHTCTVREETPQGKARGSKTKVTSADISKALEPLEGRCATLSHGYWSYQWCHRGEIIQFHDDADGKRTLIGLGKHTSTEVKRANTSLAKTGSEGGPGTADDDESGPGRTAAFHAEKEPKIKAVGENADRLDASRDALDGDGEGVQPSSSKPVGNWFARLLKLTRKDKGEKKEAVIARSSKKADPFKGINSFSEVAAVFDFYEGGASCEETGGRRHTRSSITCCATPVMETDGVTNAPMAILVSVQEVSTCSYVVQVCSRLLCPALADGGQEDVVHRRVPGLGKKSSPDATGVASARATAGGVLDVLEELEACFPAKHESWWTYKLCFSTGIRQYHEDVQQGPDGDYVRKTTAHFSLGKFDRSSVDGMGENLVQRGDMEKKGAIVLEFTEGTECDLTGLLRSSTVYLECGSFQEVKEIVEDSTCHYRLVASSPLLCSHAALMPKVTPVRTVECVVEGMKTSKTTRKYLHHRER